MKQRGFSVLELIISLAILASAGLLVMATLTRMLKPSQKAVDLSAGVVLAQSVMQEEVYKILTDAPGALTSRATFLGGDSPPAPALPGLFSVGGTDYQFEIEHQTVLDQSTGDPLGGTNVDFQAKRVTITVW